MFIQPYQYIHVWPEKVCIISFHGECLCWQWMSSLNGLREKNPELCIEMLFRVYGSSLSRKLFKSASASVWRRPQCFSSEVSERRQMALNFTTFTCDRCCVTAFRETQFTCVCLSFRSIFSRQSLHTYLIIVGDAGDAVCVNFFARCKFSRLNAKIYHFTACIQCTMCVICANVSFL